MIAKAVCLVALPLTIALAGCGGSGGSAPKAPAQDELAQFLAENPDVANAKQAEAEE